MFRRASNGWQLARQSWHVLKLDKELLLFPFISGIACMLVMASFAVPLWASGYVELVMDGNENGINQQNQIIGYVVLFAYYFVNYFVIIFFNSALIACAIIRFKGGADVRVDGDLVTDYTTIGEYEVANWVIEEAQNLGYAKRTFERARSKLHKEGQIHVGPEGQGGPWKLKAGTEYEKEE